MSATKQNFRILVVDDDQSTRSLLQSVLSAEGYECLTAHSIATAEAILRKEPVQLALLDLYLGTANGLNVLDLIKVLQPVGGPEIKIEQRQLHRLLAQNGFGRCNAVGREAFVAFGGENRLQQTAC